MNGWDSGWLKKALIGSPFAFLATLGIVFRLAGPPSPVVPPPRNAPAAVTGGAPTQGPSQTAAPSSFCRKRLLSPFRAFLGRATPDDDGPPPTPDLSVSVVDGGAPTTQKLTVHVESPPPRPAKDDLLDAFEALKLEGDPVRRSEVDVRIATVPDPRDTGFQYFFDTSLQALRLAVEMGDGDGKHNFRDAAWLPWDDRLVPDADKTKSEDCRLTTPGLVIFRHAGPDASTTKLVVLLLVGETPTTGVHQAAFVNALTVASWFERPTLKIVGPTFSGSAASMRRGLDTWSASTPPKKLAIKIATGSATGVDVAATLRGTGNPKGVESIDVVRTTRREVDLQCAFFLYAHYNFGVEPVAPRSPQHAQPSALLKNVALLHESGTEFGASGAAAAEACPFVPELEVRFPFHISALRDAYEAMDTKRQKESSADEPSVRRTVLDVSLRERGRPSSFDSDPSPKTTFAEDVTLSNLLGTLSRQGMRYVAISATDPADAIFLARKIRDVAPDVRLAFLMNDALMIHPEFHDDLHGSFVVTTYPFFGGNDFSWKPPSTLRAPRSYMPFEGMLSQGLFNAVLANESVPADRLAEYRFFTNDDDSTLPIWFSVIGRSGLVPVGMRVWPGCGDLYGGDGGSCAPAALSKHFHSNRLDEKPLAVDPQVTPPNLWHLVYALLVLLAIADRWRQVRARAPMMEEKHRRRLTLSRGKLAPGVSDHDLDLALGRAKFHLYAAIRSFILFVVFGYMLAVERLALATYPENPEWWFPFAIQLGGFLALVAIIGMVGRRILWFVRERREIILYVECPSPTERDDDARTPASGGPSKFQKAKETADSALRRVADLFGFQDTDDRDSAAHASLRQLEVLATLSILVAVSFVVLLSIDLAKQGLGWWAFNPVHLERPTPNVTLFVLRSLPLFNGVSPAATVLLVAACLYVWVVARMARLRLAHGLSVISPPNDGMKDAVSTPIRYVMLPEETTKTPCEDFTRVERGLLNTIWRPGTGWKYFAAVCALMVLPAVVFFLKHPSTLESKWGTVLLFSGLGLCVVVIAATLIQFILYWRHLELMLKRIAAHPLGRAFARAEGFVRESIDDQVSGTPNDLLRLVAAAQVLLDLHRRANADTQKPLQELVDKVRDRREEALAASTAAGRRADPMAAAGGGLGPALLEAARAIVVTHLVGMWGRKGPPPKVTADAVQSQPEDFRPAAVRKLAAPTPEWLQEAEAFVATVIALLVNRHVRQFRTFVYGLTGSALLLLAALTVYPFEPHRLLLTCIWVIMASVVGVGFWVFLELEQNTLLSSISGTKPGEVTVNTSFVFRIIGWGVLPMLSVAAAQYPALATSLFSWLEPFMRALK